jgi:hypothetical protein
MTFIGKVSHGTVVLPPGVHLPEGAEVEVRPVEPSRTEGKPTEAWRFPEGRHLGGFGAPVEDWRLDANETRA